MGAGKCAYMPFVLANFACRAHPLRQIPCIGVTVSGTAYVPMRKEVSLDSAPRSPNGFLSALNADDFELIRPHLRTMELVQESVLVEVGEPLKRAYLPHKGVISLVVKLAKGEHVQIAMI